MFKRLSLSLLLLLCLSTALAAPREIDVQLPIPNQSFELDADANQVPDGWTPSGFSVLDGRDCSRAVSGMCSLYFSYMWAFSPNRGGKSLSIVVDAVVPAGVLFHAQIFAQAVDLQTAVFSVELLDNGVVTQSFAAPLTQGTYNWRVFGDLFITTSETDQAKLKIVYYSPSGHVYFDAVSMGYLE